jgi:hypothetical protein
MMRAGTRDNADSPAEILIAAGLALSPMSLSGRDADEDADRWEADGGHVRDRS